MSKTLAQELAEEGERLRRRFIHHTRPKGPLSMAEACALNEAIRFGTGTTVTTEDGETRHIPHEELR